MKPIPLRLELMNGLILQLKINMLALDRQVSRRINKEMDEILTNAALNAILKERRNYPARLEQIVGKYLLTKTFSIIEYNNQRSYSLCYRHKFSGSAPHHFCNKHYACEICQMCTDYCPNISFSNNVKSFIRFAKDILNR